ncbi:M14 family zinc carboxypeptidase [Pleionea sp. CnH1-48]|uniref:M14 family zinc carboxypeptidase n=1 Tax=Pleionea sp. CnH1-48 TaxID=2954494 RepID=UPI002097922B|nr:M14 family zinc carboxypeptidase [Pleionea sp. CnH1-48]MCO7224489.1 proprotein convertase P-domain-containing protein [Pleionea sp. CnH1-48]
MSLLKTKPVVVFAVLTSMMSVAVAEQNNKHVLYNEIVQEKSTENIYRVTFASEDIARKAAISFHGQLLESQLSERSLTLELDAEDRKKLAPFIKSIRVDHDFIQRRNERLEMIQQRMMQSDGNASIQSIPGYECYETVEETFSTAQSLVSQNSNIAEWIDIGDSWEKTQGSGGYDLQVLKITNKSISGNKPKLFINSAIHAREYTTAPLNLEFARWLVNGYGSNADATWIVDHHEVHLLLQANPDGRKKAETGLSWRKNTNQNYCGSSSNSRGADLNRNFSSRWNITNGQGSSGSQCSLTYRGPSAASEPEIQALESYVRSIFPDSRGPNDNDAAPATTSGMHIDIHSYSELVLWPWGDQSSVAPNGVAMQTLGRKFAFFNGYNPMQSIGLYATDGTSDNISYGELGIAAFTFELGTSFFQNCSTYENTIKPDNLKALIYAAKVVRTPYITPSGPDVASLTLNGSSGSVSVQPGSNVALVASVSDSRFSTRNGTEATQNINAAEYYIDTPPWANGATPIALAAQDGSYNSKTESVGATINTTGMSNGQHIIYVRSRDTSNTWGALSAIYLNITDEVPPNDNELENNVPKTGLSGAQGDQVFFTMQVPADASNLSFNISGGSGDADMYVRFGSQPTTGAYDCRPYRNGNVETCNISNVQTGTYHVMLRGYRAYSGVSLVGSYTAGGSVGESFENTDDVSIPDNNTAGASSSINSTRSGASGTVAVEVDIVHTYIGDLVVDLIAPDGSTYNLHNRTGGTTNNLQQTYSVNVGNVDSSGTWQLKVVDRARIDTGYINRWKITFN